MARTTLSLAKRRRNRRRSHHTAIDRSPQYEHRLLRAAAAVKILARRNSLFNEG